MKLLGFEYWSCVYRHMQVLVWPAPSQLLLADPRRLELQGQGRADKISTACGAICWGLYNKYMSCTSHNSTWQPMKPDSWGGYQPGVGEKQCQGPGHRHFSPPYLGQVPWGNSFTEAILGLFSLRKEFQKEQNFNHNHTVQREEGRNGGTDGRKDRRKKGGREEQEEGRKDINSLLKVFEFYCFHLSMMHHNKYLWNKMHHGYQWQKKNKTKNKTQKV